MDPFVAAEAAGAAIVPGIVAFVVTRKLMGPGGSRELARLARLSGADGGAPSEGTLVLLFRDWSPWLMALVVATISGCFSYDKTRARAVRVSATFDTLLTCADLVSSRTLRKWTKGNHHETCVITDRPLNGMQLLTVQAVRHTSYFIYYPEYVASDRSFRKLLGG